LKQTTARLVRALGIFLLSAASIHLTLILVHSIRIGNFRLFNLFDILDLDLFFPRIAVGNLSFVISAIVSALLFVAIFLFAAKRRVGRAV